MIPRFSLSDKNYSFFSVILIILVTNLALISSTGVVIVSPVLIGELALSTNQSLWISSGYLMMVAATVPCSIFLGKKFGFHQTYSAGILILGLSSLFAGLSTNFSIFLFFRVLSGFGVGLIFPLSLSIISMSVKSENISVALSAYTGIGFGMGAVIGFLLGGIIAQYHQWPLIFYFSGGLGVLLFFLAICGFRGEKPNEKNNHFDFSGYLLFIVFSCSMITWLVSIKAAWNTEGGSSWFIRVCAFLAITSFFGLIIEENKKKFPLFFLQLFKIHSFTLGSILLFLIGGIFFSTASLFPNTLINCLNYTKIQAGYHMIIFGAALGVVGMICGFFSEKIGFRKIIVVGGVVLVFDCFYQHSFTIYSDPTQVMMILLLRGAGIGALMGPVTAWAIKEVPKELKASASIMVTIFRQLGGGLLGAWIQLIVYYRNVFHFQRFSENFDFSTSGLNAVQNTLNFQIYQRYGENPIAAKTISKEIIVDVLKRQADILSFNDAYFVNGVIIASILFVIFLILLIELIQESFIKKESA